MKFRIDLAVASKQAWVDAVINDFDSFLQDHADCERKASGMALSLVAKYPNRLEILQELMEIAIEELEHFRDVYALMEAREVQLNHSIPKDNYIQQLIKICRDGREERFMDRLLLASLVETRGAERFQLIYEALEEGELKQFYHKLWASEARHGEVFVKMALNYFEETPVYARLEEMKQEEGVILDGLEIRPALH